MTAVTIQLTKLSQMKLKTTKCYYSQLTVKKKQMNFLANPIQALSRQTVW